MRTARVSLQVTRDLAELGLGSLELVARVLGEEPGSLRDEPDVDVAPVRDIGRDREEAAPPPEPLGDDRELVKEVADPGVENGAGASLRVAPPFEGYDELRAPDVIARLRSVDTAELGETELYERTHRGRRTVLEAIAREIKRRPGG